MLAAVAILLLLVRARTAAMALPLTLIGLALLIIVPVDASFIGGWRPSMGATTGFSMKASAARSCSTARRRLSGKALEGGEAVYYYGGPGLRYLRALERFLFGDALAGLSVPDAGAAACRCL